MSRSNGGVHVNEIQSTFRTRYLLVLFLPSCLYINSEDRVVCSERNVFEGTDFFCWFRLLSEFLLHVPTRTTFRAFRADPVKNCFAQILENTMEAMLCLVLFSDYNSRKSRGGRPMVKALVGRATSSRVKVVCALGLLPLVSRGVRFETEVQWSAGLGRRFSNFDRQRRPREIFHNKRRLVIRVGAFTVRERPARVASPNKGLSTSPAAPVCPMSTWTFSRFTARQMRCEIG